MGLPASPRREELRLQYVGLPGADDRGPLGALLLDRLGGALEEHTVPLPAGVCIVIVFVPADWVTLNWPSESVAAAPPARSITIVPLVASTSVPRASADRTSLRLTNRPLSWISTVPVERWATEV